MKTKNSVHSKTGKKYPVKSRIKTKKNNRFGVYALQCPNPMPKRYKTNITQKLGRTIPIIDGLYVYPMLDDKDANKMNNMCIDIFHTLIKKQNNTMSIRGEEHQSKKDKCIKNSTHTVFNIPTRLGIYSFLSALKSELIKHKPDEKEK